MRKAAGRETAGKEKSRKTAETNKTAGKRSSTKPAPHNTFDPDALLNSMDGMVYVASPDYRLEYMNEAAIKKIGRDMTGKHCFKVFHGLEERCPWCMGGLVLQGQTFRQEILGQLDKRWYSSVLTPLHRKDGSVAIQALVFDITDQKQAQAALVQDEALLRSIHQAAPMGIGVVKSRVLDWTNEQISRMTGYTAEELRGKSARIFYADDEEFDRVGRHKYADIHSKGTGSIVTVWRRKDGRLINVFLSSTPIDPGDLPAGVVFTALDITEKKKAQDELWRSEEKYRALFENAVMGIFQSTPEGRFITVNPATATMCGFDSPDEMVAAITDIAAQHYVDPAERDLFIRAIEEKGFVKNFEHRTYRKDGSVFWVSVNAREVRDGRGRITHYEGTHEDVQWRKESEEALQASEERFSKAFRSNPAPVAITTIDEGRFIEVNDRFLEAFGYRRDEIIGRTSADLAFWTSAEGRDEVMKKLRATGSVKNVLNHYKTKSGQLRTGLWSGEIVRLGDRDVLLSILHDITERKQAEEKYQSILADIEEFYYETDLRGNLTFFNDAACNIIGYTREELQGKSNRDYTTPQTAQRMYRVFSSVYSTGEKRKINDYEVIRKDGSRRMLEISTTLKRDEHGSPNGFRGLGRDVTDRVKAEEALRLSEERYRAIFENSLVGIFQSTPEGRYIRVNPAFARIYGFESPEDAISSVSDIGTQVFVDTEDRKRCLAILKETGVLERFETRTRRKDGSIIWTAINSRIVRDAEGRTLFIEGVVDDITEQVEAQEKLKQNEALLKSVLEAAPIGIGVVHNRVLSWVNEGLLSMTGHSLDELSGKSARVLYTDDDEYERVGREKYGQIATAGKGVVETRWKARDESLIDILLSSSPIDPGDLGAGVVFTAMDISGLKRADAVRKELEGQLRQVQKMEAIGTLAGGIAHDFNNILFTIVGFTDLSLHDLSDGETRWNLTQVLNACDRAKNLVNQILAFSRQEAPERRPVDIVPVAKEALKFLRSTIPSTIELKQRITGGSLNVLSDPTTIHQVLINLGTNAAHAMRTTGGVMEVCLESVEIPRDRGGNVPADLKPGPYIRMTVRDTGVGIDPAIMNRIFDPFFTTKPQGEGTGLGLSVVYGIVKSHGGSIAIESEVGRGSTFHVYLPRTPETEHEDGRNKAPACGGSEHILFVDDEVVLVDMGERMLSVLGYRVTAVANGPEALKTFRENPDGFDLVITDMTMPGMTGAELSREILKIKPGFPIILCTGFSEIISEGEAKAMGIRRFLMKPVFLDTLAGEIRTALDASRKEVTVCRVS
jgi:two-component system cell cycle sensor histidine kinase/response regulator CckA